MSIVRQLRYGVRALLHRSHVDRDINDELRAFIDEAAAAHRRNGLSPDAALRAATIEVGNATYAAEQLRSYGWENFVEHLVADSRYAIRQLAKAPAFTAVATLTLAIGIGASTAIFSAVNPVLFDPLPYPHANRIVSISDRGADERPLAVTYGTFREIAARARSFERLAVARSWQPVITGGDRAARVDGQSVSAGYFHTLGVAPAFGRQFDDADDRPGGPNVAVISDALWRSRFAADPSIIGRTVTLDEEPYAIIGVMPPAFENVISAQAEIWKPLQYALSPPSEGVEWGHNLRMIGRLRANVTIDELRIELRSIAEHPVPQYARPPWAAMRRGLNGSRLQDEVTHGVKPALVAVLCAVALLLVIACVNVANLLLAQGARRRGELAMRVALGADAARLLQQLLTESVLLALMGGVLGVGVAAAGVRVLIALSPADLPRLGAIHVSMTALLFAVGVSAAVGIVTGLIPAVRAIATSRRDAQPGLQLAAQRTVGGHRRARRVLVVAEVAMAMVLLIGSGLLFRSLGRLFSLDPGFAPDHLLTLRVQVAGTRFTDADATLRYFDAALRAVRDVRGVTSAALTSQLPLSGDAETYGAHFESSTTGRDESNVFRYAVTTDYFAASHIPLLRGRLLDSTDRQGAPLAALINDSFARRKFPAGSAIGQHLHIGPDRGPWYTIVGVVGDVKQLSLATRDLDAVYIVPAQSWFADQSMWFVVRTRGDPLSLAESVRRAILGVDANQPVERVESMATLVARSESERRFTLNVFEAFAAAALVLAAMGLYGVLSGEVVERMRELGVRAALGASPRAIVQLVVTQGMTMVLAGVLLGAFGAALAGRMLAALLFGISALDLVTYVGVVLMLAAVAAGACAMPALRAARVDPALTLRGD